MPMPFDAAAFTEYGGWYVAKAGWVVKVPNRFLSEYSFHTGDTPSWTLGDIIGEYTSGATKKAMMVVDLGRYNTAKHMEAKDVRMAIGPNEQAMGSERNHGYG
jgi:hypothetical protein